MVKWKVIKVGAEIFDALHAYGLGIVLAYATRSSIKLKDEGLAYTVCGQMLTPAVIEKISLADVLPLPTIEQLHSMGDRLPERAVLMGNLDGLLGVLFTVPGPRLVSASDMHNKQLLKPTAVKSGLEKVHKARSRWQKYLEWETCHSANWLTVALKDYDCTSPQVPWLDRIGYKDLSLWMTFDPSFSYSTYRPISDGLITDKTNMTIRGPRFAILFALIGAAHFLRAQRVAANLVNFYIPLPKTIVLDADTTIPMIHSVNRPSDQALAYQWLNYNQIAKASELCWQGLAYQVLQTQGASQSISVDRGCLTYDWLTSLEERTGVNIIKSWKFILDSQQKKIPFEISPLLVSLTQRDAKSWTIHLRDIAIYNGNSENNIRPYRLNEVKEVFSSMGNSKHIPLSTILERERGTLRFGHALRQLSQVNESSLRDIMEYLDSVQSIDQLNRTLYLALQACTVASAKSKFMIIPDDDDLRYVYEDCEIYGAKTVAGVLIILSALRYPQTNVGKDKIEAAEPESKPITKGEHYDGIEYKNEDI